MKKVIVVGASSGIGKALAILLAENDYTIGITGRREHLLLDVKKTRPASFIIKPFDCTSENNTQKLTELTEELGGLDLLVLSSGTGKINKNLDCQIERSTIDLNVTAFTEIVNFAYHFFKTQGHGHLVVISSIAGIRGSGSAPAYNASKAYQINYLEGLRQRTKHLNLPIRITDVRPGFVDTEMAQGEKLFWVASKEKAAQQIYKALQHKREIVYVTKRWRMIAIILKILPKWIYKRM